MISRRHALATSIALLNILMLAGRTARGQALTLPQRLGPDARLAIERIADSARTAGLPVTPLVDKALEGVLKGATDERIVIAVRRLARELGDARTILGSANDAALLGATASALHAGASPSELQRLVRPQSGDAPTPSAATAAFITLADLVAKQISPAVATDAVGELLRRRARDVEFSNLRGEIDLDIRNGMAPNVALANRTRAHVRVLDTTTMSGRGAQRPPPM